MERYSIKVICAAFLFLLPAASCYAVLAEKDTPPSGKTKVSQPRKTPSSPYPVADKRISIADSPYTQDRYLYKAKKAFAIGNLQAADEYVGKSIRVYKDNKPAQAFKQNVDAVKQKMEIERLSMAREYHLNAKYLYRKGLVLDAMLENKKSLLLDQVSKDSQRLNDDIIASLRKMTDSINEDYRKKFRKAVKYFVDGKIDKSERYFRMIENQTSTADYLLPIVIAHRSDKSNRERSNEYYQAAIDQLNETRYAKAKEALALSLALDKDNVDARLLLVLVNILEQSVN
jgi:hypothetical protein